MTQPAATDPLRDWWVHQVTLRRLPSGGDGDGFGSTLGDPETLKGFVNSRNKLVRAASGDEVVSSAQVALPKSVGFVRPRSQVTLPAIFGGDTRTVIACSVGDGGGQPTPDHVVLHLE